MRFLLGVLFVSSLFASSIAIGNDKEIIRGQWGGDGVSLWAGAAGADGDFYCSMGRMTAPLEIDDDGHFCVVGVMNYYDGSGPIQQSPATFIGNVDDGVMNLTVNMPDREPWKFVLRKGEKGVTPECILPVR